MGTQVRRKVGQAWIAGRFWRVQNVVGKEKDNTGPWKGHRINSCCLQCYSEPLEPCGYLKGDRVSTCPISSSFVPTPNPLHTYYVLVDEGLSWITALLLMKVTLLKCPILLPSPLLLLTPLLLCPGLISSVHNLLFIPTWIGSVLLLGPHIQTCLPSSRNTQLFLPLHLFLLQNWHKCQFLRKSSVWAPEWA